jgi:hypothetical protein
MNSFTRYIRRHHIALLALFLALGGTSYAAISLPKASVGTDQLKHASVTTTKIAPGSVTSKRLRDGAVVRRKIAGGAISSAKVADGSLLAADFANGELPRGATGPAGPPGPAEGPAGGALTGSYPSPQIAAGAVGPDQIGEIPTVRLIRGGTALPIPAGGQGTPVPWPGPIGPRPYDIGGFFDPADNAIGQCVGQGPDTCIVFPRAGTYAISAGLRWADTSLVGSPTPDNGNGVRTLRIHGLSGRQSATTTTPAVSGTQTVQSVTTIDRFQAGEAAFVTAFQNSTTGTPSVVGSLQQVYFAATWLGP